MSKLGIVTVLFNSESVLPDFFESLNNQTYKDFILYIVDNSSPDHSFAIAEKLSTDVGFKCIFLPQSKNLGVAAGNNIGIKAALNDGCDLILLSNNDVVLNHDSTIQIMVDKMTHSNIDILCPKILYYQEQNIIWAAGGTYIKNDTGTFHFGRNEIDNGQYDEERDIRYTPTCFSMIKASVFSRIGLMDESYFVYYDDTDFMYRAWKNALKITYTPDTSIFHNESFCTGSDSPFKHFYLARNHLIFVKKHRPLLTFMMIIAYRYSALFLKHMWKRDKKLWHSELNGLNEGLIKSLRK